MNHEAYNINIPPQPEENSAGKKKNDGLTRREFLRALAIGATAVAGEVGIEMLSRNLKEQMGEDFDASKESADMESDEKDVIGKTFREQLKKERRIIINDSVQKVLFEQWREKYSQNRGQEIADCLTKMEPWIEDIKKIFAIYEVPEEFIYLTIAESNFRLNAVSGKNAVGPYQIVSNLENLDVRLAINDNIDERIDPIRSAAFCANHLRTSYEKFGNNWNLALLDYNGGFTNDYLEYLPKKELAAPEEDLSVKGKYVLQKGDTVTEIAEKFGTSLPLLYRLNAAPKENYGAWYARCEKMRPGDELLIPQERKIREDDFYEYLENRINQTIKEDLNHDSYEIRRGDTYKNLAKLLNMELDELLTFNGATSERKLEAGEKIRLPKERKTNVDYLLHILSGFKENINYPQKLYAILSVIKEEKLKPKPGNPRISYTIFKLNREISLKNIARVKNMAVENIRLVNPSIQNVSFKLTKGTVIRLPNSLHISADKEKRKNTD